MCDAGGFYQLVARGMYTVSRQELRVFAFELHAVTPPPRARGSVSCLYLQLAALEFGGEYQDT